MAKEHKDWVVGLDIGSAKVMVVIAEIMAGDHLRVAGTGIAPNQGVKHGVINNMEATVRSIQHALKEAEAMAKYKITQVCLGITGSHIWCRNSSGLVPLTGHEVSYADVLSLEVSAKTVPIANDQRLLLVRPQEFVLDGQTVKDPVGMSGVRLEAKVHLVMGANSAVENVMRCARRCGLDVAQLVLNPMASSLSVLTEDECEQGVALVDMGEGTIDVAIFFKGALRHTAVISVASGFITSDIAAALRTSTANADNIKLTNGYALQSLADPDVQVEVPSAGNHGSLSISRQVLAGVIEPRVSEIFHLVQEVIRDSGYSTTLRSGIVLTGGGCVMPGMVELCEQMCLTQVRRGVPHYTGELSDLVVQPHASTVMGLLEEARMAYLRDHRMAMKNGWLNKALRTVQDWFGRNF